MNQLLTDVWTLETPDEEAAANDLNWFVEEAFRGSRRAINYLRKLWGNESWQSIKAKLQAEGSDWYVWWMDGVRQHLLNLVKEGTDG